MRQTYRKNQVFLGLSVLAAGVIFLAGLLFLGSAWLRESRQKPEQRGDPLARYAYEPSMVQDNTRYRRRQNVTTILVMGIDRAGGTVVSGFRNGGQADFLRLVTIDHGNKTVSQLQIDRDTMASISVLGVLGDELGTRMAQICLSHGFGDGKAQSCIFTRDAVSRLLLDVPVDFYLAMNMDSISVLNDWAGGCSGAEFTGLCPGGQCSQQDHPGYDESE